MPQPTLVQSDLDLPDRCDVVVIGAGIAGVTTALELAERGLHVVVCEKGIVAGEQSSRNWGWCRQMGRDPRELPLIQVSLNLWRQMRQRLGEEVGFRECGILYLCESEKELAARADWMQKNGDLYGLSSSLIDGEEAGRRANITHVNWRGGLYTPDDGRAEPQLAVPAMARAAQRLGVQIFQQCAVRSVDRTAGKISSVITERGEISCDKVVLAGGVWSRKFCTNIGLRLPQLTVINSVMRTNELDVDVPHSMGGQKFAVRKRLDGGFTIAHKTYSVADIVPDSFKLLPDFFGLMKTDIQDLKLRFGRRFFEEFKSPKHWAADEVSPFEICRTFDPKPNDALLDEAFASLCQAIPAFKQATIAERWAGGIDVVPDAVPVISAVESEPNFYMATGFSGHGFGLGPAAGKLMAEIVCDETPCVDASPFRFERF